MTGKHQDKQSITNKTTFDKPIHYWPTNSAKWAGPTCDLCYVVANSIVDGPFVDKNELPLFLY